MRRRTHLALELALLTAGLFVALFLTLVVADRHQTAPTFIPSVLGGQPKGGVVLAQEDGELAVALALKPDSPGLLVVATVLGQDGAGASDAHVSVAVETKDGTTLAGEGTPCGPGCFETTLETTSRPVSATVTVTGPGASANPIRFAVPGLWPPRPAGDLVRRTENAYRRLKTLVTHEVLQTDPSHPQSTVYLAVAPDKLRTRNRLGSESIVIGKRRWDRRLGQPWRQTRLSAPIRSIAPYWGGIIEDPTLLGSASVGGRAAWIVSFAAPQYPAWFTVWIDKRSFRTLRLKMTASAHFMRHAYGPFDAPITITPPG